MAGLHCHSCDWSQDDFYSIDRYNPAKHLLWWNEQLCGEKQDEIDKQFTEDAQFLQDNGPITTREVIARLYEKFARRIREMAWITYEQWEKEPNKVCPKCGSSELDID